MAPRPRFKDTLGLTLGGSGTCRFCSRFSRPQGPRAEWSSHPRTHWCGPQEWAPCERPWVLRGRTSAHGSVCSWRHIPRVSTVRAAQVSKAGPPPPGSPPAWRSPKEPFL